VKIQQFTLQLEIDYVGHPYYVSGNALLHAMAPDLDYETQHSLRVSHGIFAPAQFGRYPPEHSKSGTRPGMGSSLPEVNSYADLSLCRDPQQDWLLNSRPRDLLNVHDVRRQSGQPSFQPETVVNLPEHNRHDTSTTSWCINCYAHATDDSVLPLADSTLDGLHLGGRRNYGYGETSLKDTQVVDLDTVDFSAIRDADELLLKLTTPYVLTSDDPHADDQRVPYWWGVDGSLRTREEQIVEQREEIGLHTVDHGQVVRYTGDSPVKTARTGLTRTGPHAKYGFGEFQVIPV